MKLLLGTVICIMPYAQIFEFELECCELENYVNIVESIYVMNCGIFLVVECMDYLIAEFSVSVVQN